MPEFALPVYVTLDVSASTAPIIPQLNDMVTALVGALKQPAIADIGYLCVISFSEAASVALPLTPVLQITALPALKAEVGTHYGPVLKLLRESIEHDVAGLKNAGLRVFRPLVFFVTDGPPLDPQWEHELDLLMGIRTHPTIFAVGLPGIDTTVLRRVASRPELALVTEPGRPPEDALAALVRITQSSVLSSSAPVTESGTLTADRPATFVVPEGLSQLPQDWI